MKKTERRYVELDLAAITGASENIRDTVPRLSHDKYGVFAGTDEHAESLTTLALSNDSGQQAEFVKLIEDSEQLAGRR